MGVLTHILNQTCEIVTSQLNKYGEQEIVSTEEVYCRFREITEVSKFSNREDVSADALLWLEPDTSVERGTIIKFDSQYYRVERLTKARRMKNTDVVFAKCLLEKHKSLA